ncbi:MAG: tRNA uridine-5-carboxymethylaminomethyl(34) synthesis GTPase MnmE [Segatella oulorum]
MNDTICALATSAGGAIGIIRVSGDKAIRITDELFKAKNKKQLSDAKGNTLHYGEFCDAKQQPIDEVVISVYKAPHSYTGEDSTEISCHGSAYILKRVMQALIDKGCRSAQPGEYTQRAYLNGKMDLSQAEAVADLVSASNKASHQLALSQIRGHFSNELSQLRNMLLHITSLLELELDFSDHEELEFADRKELKNLAETIHQRIAALTKSFETGKAVKEGVPVAIVGKTNVGKSTLLNCLLHEEKAIVSDIHGTTRDVIEDTTEINGITFRFIDTAGIRRTDNTIEQMGIERTYMKLNEAAIILWIVDQTPTKEEFKLMQSRTEGKQLIMVYNKADLNPPHSRPTPPTDIAISAKYQQNIQALEQLIFQAAHLPEINENSVILTNARHYEALTRADEMIIRVIESLNKEISGDLISEDLRVCLSQLAEITGGQITPNEVLGNIFKHFCIGK